MVQCQARAAPVKENCGSGTGRWMNWAWPPSRSGETTVPRATSSATAAPWSRRILWNVSAFDVSSNDELHDALSNLPMFPCSDMMITRLGAHPAAVC
jgi:hypothetical protein